MHGIWIIFSLVFTLKVVGASQETASSRNDIQVLQQNQCDPIKHSPLVQKKVVEAFPPPDVIVKTVDDYLLVRRLGTGKFSDVFEAVDVELENTFRTETRDQTNDVIDPRCLVVVKCLKPVSERKIRREVLVLQRASMLPNLVQLRAFVVRPDEYDSEAILSNENVATSHGRHNDHRKGSKVPKMPSLVLEHAGPDSQWLCHPRHNYSSLKKKPEASTSLSPLQLQDNFDDSLLSDYEIRYYLFQLLIALDALHSNGIMHRDVKPRNVLINRHCFRQLCQDKTEEFSSNRFVPSSSKFFEHRQQSLYRPLMLIDLGLADFYLPAHRYNVRVASRHYKAPELLVGYEYYHYSVDMWGFGCILVGLLFQREPFFRGKDNHDQLAKIVAILGTDDFFEYLQKYQIVLDPQLAEVIQQLVPTQRQDFLTLLRHHSNQNTADARIGNHEYKYEQHDMLALEIDLLEKILVYDHENRLTAKQAMQHAYFDSVRTS